MKLTVRAKTKITDLVIDYIEVINERGKRISLNWERSEVFRIPNGFKAHYDWVEFGEESAPENLKDLQGIKVYFVGLYSEQQQPLDIDIEELQFEVSPMQEETELILRNVYYTEDNAQEEVFRSNLQAFMREWLKKNHYDVTELFSVEEDDEDSGLVQTAYDMKVDIYDGEINPFTQEQKQDKSCCFGDCYYTQSADVIIKAKSD